MRHVTALALGLLLAAGTAFHGPGHLHASPREEAARGLHVDHVHLGPEDGSHHPHGQDRSGDPGSVSLERHVAIATVASRTDSGARPVRHLIGLTPFSASARPRPEAGPVPRESAQDPPGDPPPLHSQHGRAPPA